MPSKLVGRFAPTPSGRLHLGNLFCALVAWLAARSEGGRFLLRIEDLDPDRTWRHLADQGERDMEFLGLDFDEGGSHGGANGPYYQSQCTQRYEQILKDLSDKGLLYPCFCSRAQLHAAQAPHASDGEPIYDGRCRNLSLEEIERLSAVRSPAVRLRVPDEVFSLVDGHYGFYEQNLARDCGDFILRRSDGIFGYQLAVVADDAAMGVTQVVRGRDLLSSSPRQIYLFRLLGKREPQYFHLPLLLSHDGRRLSKRDRDLDLDALRAKGYTGADIVGCLAYAAGWIPAPAPITPAELLPYFSWEKLPREDILLPAGLLEDRDCFVRAWREPHEECQQGRMSVPVT